MLLIERAAAAIFGAAAAFAVYSFGSGLPLAAIIAIGGALGSFTVMRLASKSSYSLAVFETEPLVPAGDPLLTSNERLPEDELLLEDLLVPPPSDSRVVQLFDCTLPTAGELQQRIERHLRSTSQHPAPPDATEELRDALDVLRRSLR